LLVAVELEAEVEEEAVLVVTEHLLVLAVVELVLNRL
jgi:hypothetical protein